MTKPSRSSLANLLSVLAFAGVACGPPNGPLPPPYFRTVDGVVVGVDERSPAEQMAQGVRVTIQPEGSPVVLVDLAPGWYLNQQGLHFSERERLRVQGASGTADPVLHAHQVSNGSVTVRLRDERGRPFWDPKIVPEPQ